MALAVSGSPAVSGSLTLSGADAYTGGTTINSGATLTLGNNGTTGSVTGSIADNGTLAINRSDGFALNNVSGSGKVVQEGSGTTILGSGLSYSGGTTIAAGTLSVGNPAALGSGGLKISGGELLATATETIANQLTMSGNFTIAAAHNQTLTISSSQSWALNPSNGEIIDFGAAGQDGTVVFDDTVGGSIGPGSYTVAVQAGTLKAGDSGLSFLLSIGAATIVQSSATLDAAGINLAVTGLQGAGHVTNSSATAVNFYVYGGGNFSGVIDGALMLLVNNGSLTLSAADAYTGGTTINSGATLTLGNGGSTGSITGNIADNGALEFRLSSTSVETGMISGAGSLLQDGTGATVLTKTNTYSGGTLLGGGTLELQKSNSAGSGAITFLNGAGATLKIDGTAMPSNAILNFTLGDAIDLANILATSESYSGGVLTLMNGSATVAQLNLATPASHPYFGLGADGGGGTLIDLEPPPPVDFNGDGNSDILLQNTGGPVAIWEMNGANVIAAPVIGNPGASWKAIGAGDFNRDGYSDILLQNTDGTAAIWEMNGATVIAAPVIGNPGASWQAIGTGDFNRDGYSDILWQNTDGTVAIWEMIGATPLAAPVIANPGTSWQAIGSGDFNGDGYSDILLQNTDGAAAIWEMNGTSVVAAPVIGNPGASWKAIGAGDFNGDGHADILWQNTDGTVAIWEMIGANVIAAPVIGNPGPSWKAIGAEDFNGDGHSDILWQNTDGAVAIWEMNGATVIAAPVIGNPGTSWHPILGGRSSTTVGGSSGAASAGGVAGGSGGAGFGFADISDPVAARSATASSAGITPASRSSGGDPLIIPPGSTPVVDPTTPQGILFG